MESPSSQNDDKIRDYLPTYLPKKKDEPQHLSYKRRTPKEILKPTFKDQTFQL